MALTLPDRYRTPWRTMLVEELKDLLVTGVWILDIGSGRTPAIRLEDRPSECHYVGLDIDRRELDLAAAGGYSEVIQADAGVLQSELVDRFDIVLSWQLLEHVQSTSMVIDRMHSYLKPGGRMLSMLSGKNTIYALPNRIIPHVVAKQLLSRLVQRDPETVFPAVYDECSYSDLRDSLRNWGGNDVRCFYRGASYLSFVMPLQWLYLRVEDWFVRTEARDLATHYLIVATK